MNYYSVVSSTFTYGPYRTDAPAYADIALQAGVDGTGGTRHGRGGLGHGLEPHAAGLSVCPVGGGSDPAREHFLGAVACLAGTRGSDQ